MKYQSIDEVLDDIGPSELAKRLTEHTGIIFTRQRVDHWRKQGVPYPLFDDVYAVTGLGRNQMRK